jgi:membrane protein required for colicin V production
MEFIDIILLIIIGGFALFGLWFGFIHTLGSLIGTVLGIYLASRFYEPFASWVTQVTGWGSNFSRVIMFTIAFVIINRLVGFVFWLLDKGFSLVTHLPFIRSIDRLFGLVLGLLEGTITVGLVIFFIERYPLSQPFMEKLSGSIVAPFAVGVATILWPLLPQALKVLRSTVDYVHAEVLNYVR